MRGVEGAGPGDCGAEGLKALVIYTVYVDVAGWVMSGCGAISSVTKQS